MRRLKRFALVIGGFLILLTVAFIVSPWPSVLVIRAVFDADSKGRNVALAHLAKPDIVELLNEPYGREERETLNVFYQGQPSVSPQVKPTVIWIHGGAFIAGQKEDLTGYLKILAGEGFTTIAVGYDTGPSHQYPTPVEQMQLALAHISENAERFGVDRNRIFLAGDSAGAQLAAQSALIISNTEYALTTAIKPLIAANQVKGILLWCGVYDPRLGDGTGVIGYFVRTVMMSYFGERYPAADDQKLAQFAVINHDLSQFPPVFISVGNDDPLEAQSRALAEKLELQNVQLDTLFFDEAHQPALGHEYQFNFESSDGKIAFDRMLAFLRAHSS